MVDIPKFGPKTIEQIISEINHIRKNPKSYARKLRNYATQFKGNVLRLENMKNGLITTEGPSAYKEAATFLEQLPKLGSLFTDENLNNAAQAMANEMSNYSDFAQMSSIDRDSIINSFGTYEGKFGESTDFGSLYPEMIVMNLIVDDGDERRRNRNMMFDSNFNQIGVGICSHDKFKSITVIMYANEFIPGKGEKRTHQKATQREIDGGDPLERDAGYRKDLNTDTAKYNFAPGTHINYRHKESIDPEKDLITDRAKENDDYYYDDNNYGGENYIVKSNKNVRKDKSTNEGNFQSNYRKKIDVSTLGGKGNNNRENVNENNFEKENIITSEKAYGKGYFDNKKIENSNQNKMAQSNRVKNNPNINVNSGFNEDDDLPEGVLRIEKNERFIIEKGEKKKITKIVRYMENGDINTELFKTKV